MSERLEGDVRDLRRLGNQALPGIGNGFAEASRALDGLADLDRVLDHDDVDATELKSAWIALRTAIQRMTAANADSLHAAGVAVNRAADAFVTRDGLNAQEIDEALPRLPAVEPANP